MGNLGMDQAAVGAQDNDDRFADSVYGDLCNSLDKSLSLKFQQLFGLAKPGR
jgi:hypothetical protein